eukprot:COSAG06_NODE_12426_length_1384_cov_1.086381_2_plen_56_part_00
MRPRRSLDGAVGSVLRLAGGDFDLSALLDIEVPRALTVPLGLFGIIAGAVMGTHG